jgi:hypothetical protein
VTGDGFKFFSWDAERTLEGTGDNRISASDSKSPGELFSLLRGQSAEFRVQFGDHVQKHLFNGGVLTPAQAVARWSQIAALVKQVAPDESARWGDYRRDVAPAGSPLKLLTYSGDWIPENNRIVGTYFTQRPAKFISQLQSAGLFPAMAAPSLFPFGGHVSTSDKLILTTPSGTIYYTTNGIDPRVPGTGAIDASAAIYATPFTLGQSALLKARVLNGADWSALTEAPFQLASLGIPIRITEIMYNPVGGDDYEFIELQNTGAQTVDLSGASFEGIDFVFPPGSTISAGSRIVLASNNNPASFRSRYPNVTVTGWYGHSLSDNGERLALLDRNLNTITSVDFSSSAVWPNTGGGQFSIEMIDASGDPGDPANWRASSVPFGTPGSASGNPSSPLVRLNELMSSNLSAVENEGAFPDWIELFNLSAAPVDLAHWSLSNNNDPRRFIFPGGTLVESGGYLLVWCDSATNAPGLHTGFTLDRSAGAVFLFDSSTNRIDGVSYGPQITDSSLAIIDGHWKLAEPTPRAANLAKTLGTGTNLFINEWLANAAPGEADWLELYNREALPVALTGFYLTTSNQIFQITSPAFVPAGSFVRLWADEKAGADHLDFKLSSTGDVIALYDPTTLLLDRVNFGPQTEGTSQGRYPDGSDQIKTLPEITPGASNVPILKINEIAFGPGAEFHARVTGPRNAVYTLQTSSNLHDWTDLQSYPAPSGSVEVSDTSPTAGSAHFYRIVIQ